jgi:hypothetical protein
MSGPALGRSSIRDPSLRHPARPGTPFRRPSQTAAEDSQANQASLACLPITGPPTTRTECVCSARNRFSRGPHALEQCWPNRHSGEIPDAGGITWGAVQRALREGKCGLPGGSTIHRLLAARRHARRLTYVPRLSEEQILEWADEHYRRFHKWPKVLSGSIFGAESEAWHRVDMALRCGLRGLRGGSSLACLLAEKRGKRNSRTAPPLLEERLLSWADAFYQRSGKWPNTDSGPIAEAPADSALRAGIRGLPGGSSLFQLLARERSVENDRSLRLRRVNSSVK